MIDYFALLDEPRRPWIEPNELKEKYHRLTLASHPDTGTESTSTDAFADLNKAYRTLSDPRQRLWYLLTLEGHTPTANAQSVPNDLADIFLDAGRLNQQIDSLTRKQTEATTGLAKSILTRELLEIQMQLKDQLEPLRPLYKEQLEQLQSLNDMWSSDRACARSHIAEIYGRITYLSRWIEQLEEKRVQLSL